MKRYKLVANIAYVGHINSRIDSQQFVYNNLYDAEISFNFLCEKQKQNIEKYKSKGKEIVSSLTLYNVDDDSVIKEEINT